MDMIGKIRRLHRRDKLSEREIAVKWALDGHGILMRAEWDIRDFLADGRLVQVLPEYDTPGADIYAMYAQRHQLSARIRAFVEFLAGELRRSAQIVRPRASR